MSKAVQKTRFTFPEWVTLIWFGIDAFTHLSIELGYVCLALTTTAAKSDTYLGHIWREYGRADARWAIRDANVISIEIATVTVGILCLFQIYGVLKRSSWRHVLQVIICVAELYGGWMTFAPGMAYFQCIMCFLSRIEVQRFQCILKLTAKMLLHVILTEWIEGNPNLNGSDFNLLWIYLVFMNGLWVVVPLLLLWDSYARISNVR